MAQIRLWLCVSELESLLIYSSYFLFVNSRIQGSHLNCRLLLTLSSLFNLWLSQWWWKIKWISIAKESLKTVWTLSRKEGLCSLCRSCALVLRDVINLLTCSINILEQLLHGFTWTYFLLVVFASLICILELSYPC